MSHDAGGPARKRLRLNRETLRDLTPSEAQTEAVRGGTLATLLGCGCSRTQTETITCPGFCDTAGACLKGGQAAVKLNVAYIRATQVNPTRPGGGASMRGSCAPQNTCGLTC